MRTHNVLVRAGALVALAAGLSCGRPVTGAAPAIAPRAVLYACGRWQGEVPADTFVTADVFRPEEGGTRLTGPPLEDRELARRLGAVVLYSYHLRGMRVRIQRDSVPSLAGRIEAIYRVDSDRHDVPFAARYHPDRYAAAVSALRSGGADLHSRLPKIRALFGTVPDESLPSVLAPGDFESFSADQVGCAFGQRVSLPPV